MPFRRGRRTLVLCVTLFTTTSIAGCGLALDYDAPRADLGLTMDASTELDASRELDASSELDGGSDASDGGTGVIDAVVSSDASHDSALASDAGRARGECANDIDCPQGGPCVELVAGGYRVCLTPPVLATSCTAGRDDACCTSAGCMMGACLLGPIRAFCGGPVRIPANVCASDECTHSTDCPSGVCARAGTLAPVAICLDAACTRDADCTDEAGGACVLARDPCCSSATGLVCSYPSDGCTTSADCGANQYCTSFDGRALCQDGMPLCPL